MKHPRFRCKDITHLDPAARDEVYDFIRSTKELLPEFIRNNMVRFEHCGSMVFGNNQLRSDWDFNIAMKDWNDQVTARRIFYGNIGNWRAAYEDKIFRFTQDTGLDLKIDVGAVDCDTVKYNICVTLDDMMLHHRFSQPPEAFTMDANGIIWEQEDKTIDLLTFDPKVGPCPPAVNQHLKWNFMLHRWQRIMLDGKPSHIVPYLDTKKAEWAASEEKWPDEVSYWKERYGDMFQSYTKVGDRLIQD